MRKIFHGKARNIPNFSSQQQLNMIKEVLNEKETLQYSEDAEIRYYGGNAICVDNFDTEVEFDDEVSFQASIRRDRKGSIVVTPHGMSEYSRGPRSIVLCDTGVAKLKQSPKGTNMKVEIILPAEIATTGNFLRNLRELFAAFKRKGGKI